MFLCTKKRKDFTLLVMCSIPFPDRCVLSGNHLGRIKLGLGKEFSTSLTFVALSRVRTSDGIMIVDRLDFPRVQNPSSV